MGNFLKSLGEWLACVSVNCPARSGPTQSVLV
jgi:hypothetical protein